MLERLRPVLDRAFDLGLVELDQLRTDPLPEIPRINPTDRNAAEQILKAHSQREYIGQARSRRRTEVIREIQAILDLTADRTVPAPNEPDPDPEPAPVIQITAPDPEATAARDAELRAKLERMKSRPVEDDD
ncbi:MAG: hypothetical protein KF889_04935 [Alphaproteobacteria bacterium]|nr:hypothetical protein [Alphaproteobacteria bacterium]MCW5742214.1 hypothetical protein [Alphaproteobacteria bacterium]